MSPELLGMDASDDFVALKQRREGKYDAKACDVWALGVMLYVMTVGDYPFGTDMVVRGASLPRATPAACRVASRRKRPAACCR